MNAIAAVSLNWGIGKGGDLLFHIKEDMQRFRALTSGGTVIMGRKTLESMPGGNPLPKRRNIVITRNPGFSHGGVEVARSIREDYLHQNAFHEVDTFTSMKKQLLMLRLIYEYNRLAGEAVDAYADFSDILACPCREKIGRAKYIPEEELASFDGIFSEMNTELKAVAQGGEEDV